MLSHSFFALARLTLVAVLAAPSLCAQASNPEGGPRKAISKNLPDLGLVITLPAQLTDVTSGEKPGNQSGASWKGKLGGCDVEIALSVLPNTDFGFLEPEDVSDHALEQFRSPPEGTDPSFAYEKSELVSGSFGWAPYAALGWGPFRVQDGTKMVGKYYTLGGLLEKHGYCLEVVARPAPTDADEAVVLEFLKRGVVYNGKTRGSQWTDDEAKARWLKDAPPATHKKLKKILRSKHYLVLTNSDGGQRFADRMEECYAAIQKTYPFPEVAGRMLMPIFLFRTSDEYFAFYAKAFETTVEEARESAGVASGDFYATWFEAAGDTVHIHEATHQIFDNRLRLSGGGSWFQEGVAEYMATKRNDRNEAARAVKNKKHTPLAEFIRIEDLLAADPSREDKKGEDKAATHYALAALLIEFLRESEWGKNKFQEWVHAIGYVPDNNSIAIERATQAVYHASLSELEMQWIEYCKKR